MTPEQILVAQLVHQRSRLRLDTRYVIHLEQKVLDHTGHELPPPHCAGWAQRVSEGAVTIKFLDTVARRTAKAMVAEELVDAIVSDGKIRLTAGPDPPMTVRFSDLRAMRG